MFFDIADYIVDILIYVVTFFTPYAAYILRSMWCRMDALNSPECRIITKELEKLREYNRNKEIKDQKAEVKLNFMYDKFLDIWEHQNKAEWKERKEMEETDKGLK